MGNAATVETRLRSVIQTWLMPIAPGCEQYLMQKIQQAAQQIEADGLADDVTKLWEAETNLRRLLTEMTRQAGIQGFQELHEPTLNGALSQLCPLWPFC